jgi:transposase InsO family protein
MDLRLEYVTLAQQEGANRRALCRRFGISAQTGYRWLRRFCQEGEAGLMDRSRRPKQSPRRTPAAMETLVLAQRAASNGAWGGRKIGRRLRDLGHAGVPSASTITEILRRHEALDEAEAAKHAPWRRFEHDAPNALWQADYKGHFPMAAGRCHPLTVLDDHARYALGLEACANEQGATVEARLRMIFRRYGLPRAMLFDNGPPWGDPGGAPFTQLGVWLIELGIRVIHARPHHPQTLGKDERFHRTLKAEVIRPGRYADLAECQRAFDAWRHVYNHQRPHEALELETPSTRYHPSPIDFPEVVPPFDYGPTDQVRKVQDGGRTHFKGRTVRLSTAFQGKAVAFRPTREDGVFSVHFRHQAIAAVDIRDGTVQSPVACGFDGDRCRDIHNSTGPTTATEIR